MKDTNKRKNSKFCGEKSSVGFHLLIFKESLSDS